MALDVKALQGYSVNARVPQNSILGPSGFPRYVNDLSDDVTYSIAIYVEDITLYSKWDQASDSRQQLKVGSNFNLTYETLE